MSRQTYADGVLVEEWNDQTRTYTNFITDETRPYTAQENAEADAEAAAVVAEANKKALLDGLALVISRATDYQATAQGIIDDTNQNINSSPAQRIKALARAQKRSAGDIIRLARIAGQMFDSASTGNSD